MDWIQSFWTIPNSLWGWLTWIVSLGTVGLVLVVLALLAFNKSLDEVISLLVRVLGPLGESLGKLLAKLVDLVRDKGADALAAAWDALKFWFYDNTDNMKSFLVTLALGFLVWMVADARGYMRGKREVAPAGRPAVGVMLKRDCAISRADRPLLRCEWKK